MQIALQLTLEETNLILEGLGHLPYGRVYALVAKIQGQAGEQLKARAECPPSAPVAGAGAESSS
jgi:hypothetical protein